jgi:predicted  nucleic acid-binding Zn-ribbon protein
MRQQFTVAEQRDYYRQRCAQQSQEIQRLQTEKGLDSYRRRCEADADKKNLELKSQVADQKTQILKLEKELIQSNGKLAKEQDETRRLNRQISSLEAEIKELKGKAKKDSARIKELESELEKVKAQREKAERKLEKDITENQNDLETLQRELEKKNRELVELQKQVASLGGKVEKLEHQRNTDSTNSSKPTSFEHFQKPVQNSREETGRSPGAQPDHPFHGRQLPGIPGKISLKYWGDDDPLWQNPEYSFERYELKHVVRPIIMVEDQYVLVPVFRNTRTGAHKNADCPDWIKDDINYGPEVKAMLLWMNVFSNQSVGKCRDMLSTFSYGVIKPSTGFISGLSVEFAIKSEPERAQAFREMVGADIMNVDGTVIRVGGYAYNVTICVSGADTLYFFKPYKGERGVKDTPIETTCAVLVSDHDIVYYNYGSGHQECLQHIERYLLDSIEVEPEYTWNIKALEFIRKLIRETKEVDEKRKSAADSHNEDDAAAFFDSEDTHSRFSPEMKDSYIREYMEILDKGLEEYKTVQNKTWYTKGINLCKRMHDDPMSYLGFMDDDRIPLTNNNAEQKARQIKRKLAGAMEFRGFLGVIAYCEAMSVVQIIKGRGDSVLENMTEIFSREVQDEDVLRMERIHEKTLGEAIEKDITGIEKLEGEISKAKDRLEKAEEEHECAEKKYAEAREERCQASGEDSEPSNMEKEHQVRMAQSDHEVYLCRRDLKQLILKLEKRKKHKAISEQQRKDSLHRITVLEKRIQEYQSKKAPEGSKSRDTDQEFGKVDGEKVSAAEFSFRAAQTRVDEAMKKLQNSNNTYYEIIHPSRELRASSRKSILIEGEKQEDKNLEDEAARAEKAVDAARREFDEAVAELSKTAKAVDAVKKDRRPGRRARRQMKENIMAEASGKMAV